MTNVFNTVKGNLGTIGAGVSGLAVGGILGYAAGRRTSKRKKSKRKVKTRSSRKRNYRNKRRIKVNKRTSHRRIRYTRKGQPYIIKANGRALFIKKKSARISKKRKGGRY